MMNIELKVTGSEEFKEFIEGAKTFAKSFEDGAVARNFGKEVITKLKDKYKGPLNTVEKKDAVNGVSISIDSVTENNIDSESIVRVVENIAEKQLDKIADGRFGK